MTEPYALFPDNRVCVSLGANASVDSVRAASAFGLVEFRLDLLTQPLATLVDALPDAFPFMVTCRDNGAFSEADRIRRLIEGISLGATWVDLDVNDAPSLRDMVLREARRHDTRLLLSHHNYQGPAGKKELDALLLAANSLGAQAVKLACVLQNTDELKSFLDDVPASQRVLPVGMGPMAISARIRALQAGALFTYACLDEQDSTAPGQPTVRQLREAWNR